MPPALFPLITGVILDGGKASRFGGAHKSFVLVDGRPIAVRTVDLFRELFGDVLTATSRPDPWTALGVRSVADSVTDAGPLAGLAAGLLACRTPLAFVVAGDMPSLSRDVIEALCARALISRRCVIPIREGRPEPLHAVYPTSLGPMALDALNRGTRKLTHFLEEAGLDEAGLDIDWVDAAEFAGLPGAGRTFHNVNTPEDLSPGAHGPV